MFGREEKKKESSSELPTTAIKRRRRNELIYGLRSQNISGRGWRSVRELPTGVFRRIDKTYKQLPSVIHDLQVLIQRGVGNDLKTCKKRLYFLDKTLGEDTAETHKAHSEYFYFLGGVNVLVKLLWNCYSLHTVKTSQGGVAERDAIINESLALLREICFSVRGVSEQIASDSEFIVALFTKMKTPAIFDNAVGLAEELISFEEDRIFDLSSIPHVEEFILSLSTRRLAFFCRLLTLVVFDPDRRGKRRDRDETNTIVDKNHALLVGIPGFIQRMVKLIHFQTRPGGPSLIGGEQLEYRFPSTANLLLPLLVELNEDEENDWERENEENRVQDIDWLTDPSLFLRSLTLATHLGEVLFVLSAISGGKKKSQVQNELTSLGLINELCQLFEGLPPWNKVSARRGEIEEIRERHGAGCECLDPDSALKIQFLRLVLYYCDREMTNPINPKLFLCEEELQRNTLLLSSSDNPGLLSKLIRVFVNLPPVTVVVENSHNHHHHHEEDPHNELNTIRFWLASCIEAFLRASSRNIEEHPTYQLLIGNSPLLKQIIKDLIYAGTIERDFDADTLKKNDSITTNGVFQTCFDLLGEIAKYNIRVFPLIDAIGFTKEELDLLMATMKRHLVDSNVFLRALVLSIEQARQEGKNIAEYSSSLHFFSTYIESHKIELLQSLMQAIKIDEIANENICCINTTIIFFIFEDRKNNLQQTIEEVFLADRTETSSKSPSLENFKTLMDFWKGYYAKKETDKKSLEHYSRISFVEWQVAHDAIVLSTEACLNSLSSSSSS